MPSVEARRRNTLWARRKREAALDAARRGRRTCPRRRGHYGECGGLLEHEVLRDGTIRTTCPRCERKWRGICQDCPLPVEGAVGKALCCRACKRRERAAAAERYRQRLGRAEVNRRARAVIARRKADPARYAHYLAVKKAWRVRNVVRIKLQKRKWRLNPDRPNGYSSREKYEAYHRAYRAEHAAHRRELAKGRYYELHPDRPHPVCACGCAQAIPWDGNGRPRKWLPQHDPWPRPLTAKETLMKGVERATQVLERAREQVQKKLAGVEQLQAELAAIERAIAELRAVANASTGTDVALGRGGRRRRAAAAA